MLFATIGKHTQRHDREGSFVTEVFDALPSSGYLALAVPEELGGRSATSARSRWPGAYYKSSPIEQCYRDVRGAKFHPLGPEESLVHTGKVALGLPADER